MFGYLLRRILATIPVMGVVALFVLLNRHTHNREARSVMVFFLKISFASAVAGIVCFRLTTWFQARVAWHNRPGALMILVLVTSVGVLVTIAMARILGISELNVYLRKIATKRIALRSKLNPS